MKAVKLGELYGSCQLVELAYESIQLVELAYESCQIIS